MIWEVPLKRILLPAIADPAWSWARDDIRRILSDRANENSGDLEALIREIAS